MRDVGRRKVGWWLVCRRFKFKWAMHLKEASKSIQASIWAWNNIPQLLFDLKNWVALAVEYLKWTRITSPCEKFKSTVRQMFERASTGGPRCLLSVDERMRRDSIWTNYIWQLTLDISRGWRQSNTKTNHSIRTNRSNI